MKKSGLIFSLSNELPQVFAVMLAFFMPFFPKIVPLVIALMVVSSFIQFKKLKYHSGYRFFAFLFVTFYFCYVLAMGYSDNLKEGWFDLQVKLSFLVIPLFFLFHGPVKYKNLRALFAFYILGSLIATFVCLYHGYQCYSESGDMNCFFSSFITKVIHASYLAVYFCFAILILVHSLINYFSRMNILLKIISFFLILYFSVFVFLLSSKGGILAWALVIIVSVVYYFYKAGRIKNILLIFSLLSVFCFILFSFSSYVRVRFETAFDVYQLSEEELFSEHHNSTESTAVRLMIWTVAIELIEENPLGLGTGDNKDNLMLKYKERNMNGAYDLKLNCHNQYLETTLSIGIIGLCILVSLLLFGIYRAIAKKNFLLLWVLAIISLNLFFESFFERQAGIVFFVFFTWLLYTSVPSIVPLIAKKAKP